MRLLPNHPSDASLQVQYFHLEEEFVTLRDAWSTLLPHSKADSVFLTWEWLSCWWHVYGKQKQLWLVTAWQGETLVGIAPMMLASMRRYGLELHILRSLGAPDIDIGGFVIRDDDPIILAALCRALVEKVEDWDILEFNQFMSESATTVAMRDYFTEAGFVVRQVAERHFYLPTLGDWDHYYQQLYRKFRVDLRRNVRRAEERGLLSFERYTGRDVTQAHLSKLFQLNEHSRYSDVYYSTEEQEFQRTLLNRISHYGWPDLSLLCIDSRPIAYIYGFIFNSRFEAWRGGFDMSYSEISAGKLILMYLLEDCFRCGYREVDFLRGDEGYKEQWQPRHRLYYTRVRVVSPRKRALMFAFVWVPDLKARIRPLRVRLLGLSLIDTLTDTVRKAKQIRG